MPDTRARGIDVSHYQGKIDWHQVADRAINFAFIKATDGSKFVDPLLQENWVSSREAGILRGAYHFFRANQDPAQQAEHYLSSTPGLAELPAVLDFEVIGNATSQEALSPEQRRG
jgi:lysozyme